VEQLVSLGGSKFNVSTELKHVLINTTFEYISKNRDEYNPGKLDIQVKDAIRGAVSNWIDMLGSEGKA
jgi:fructose/tagatose bisphosphate aldolase